MLTNRHLVAEWRELLRMPRFALKYDEPPKDMPERFTLGKGHMKSLLPHMQHLWFRQWDLGEEMEARDFKVDRNKARQTWDNYLINRPNWQLKRYMPNPRDFNLVLTRLKERDPSGYENVEFKSERNKYTCK
jgi:hypothetical protein